jgi:serine/threonine protein kinase
MGLPYKNDAERARSMDISEVQRHFTAYGSGELPEGELRNSIREALSEDPYLSPAFVALADAYRRANLIDADLQSAIIADITEVTGPKSSLTIVRPARPAPFDSSRPNGSDTYQHPRTQPTARSLAQSGGSSPSSTGSSRGSAWDTDERLAEVATALFPGAVLRDRFELVQELGRGGMGVVYKAFDRSRADMRERYVAIKVLNEEFKRHPLAVRALQREARKAQKLAHPNVVTVHDCDRDGGNVYMVMELLSGRSLDQVIRGDGKGGIPAHRALEIVKCLGAALSYAHEQDIVHCDFKPSNAFLTDEGKVKVLDFGIARAAPSRVERGEKTMFDAGQLGAISPPYASVEMIRGAEPDIRDDVYALACVAYELLSGYHPFQRIDAQKAEEMGLQPRVVRGLSRSQWRALKQGLAFRRADRSATVDSFVTQLVASRNLKKSWLAVTAAVVIAVAAAAILVWQWNAPRVAVLQREIMDTEPARVSAALAELRAAAYLVRAQTLANGETRNALASYFRKEMQEATAAPGYDYQRARALLGELNSLLPNSRPVIQLSRQLNLEAQADLARQIQDRDRALSGAILLPSQGDPNFTDVLGRIRKIDPKNAALTDPLVASTYAKAASAALDGGRFALAKEIVTAGLSVVPDDSLLLGMRGQFSTAGGDSRLARTPGVETRPPATTSAQSSPGGTAAQPAPIAPVGAQSRPAAVVAAQPTTTPPKPDAARSSNQETPEMVAASVALARDQAVKSPAAPGEQHRVGVELTKEKLETQAATGDVAGANTTATALGRTLGGSAYVARDVPQMLISSYLHRAKAQFAAGQVDDSLVTIAEGRKKFGKSPELHDLELRYVAAADFYDRLSSAVALNVADRKRALEDLRAGEGEEYSIAEKMLAQTLANRIADQRAANRATVADRLLEAGQEIFPDYSLLLGQGTAGVLSSTPAVVRDSQ